MKYQSRILEDEVRKHLKRKKSILLLGPRQTGKTTLVKQLDADMQVSLMHPDVRQRYEQHPSQLRGEIDSKKKKNQRELPLVVIDEIQKVPKLLDLIQALIDESRAQFILTGSSARKLKQHHDTNLLPGRVVTLRLDPFVQQEYPDANLEDLLRFGSLPAIAQEQNEEHCETDLASYVETYLEEEIRAEALVRKIGSFARFLEYAGAEAGKIVNFHKLSQEVGVSHTTIASFYEVLVDCLVAERVEPITESHTRTRLTKSSRYLLFDLGVQRLCAREGLKLSKTRMGEYFENYVGLELIRLCRLKSKRARVRFWRDPNGPEVDWVIENNKTYTPVEVKWTDTPQPKHAKHIELFLDEYEHSEQGFVICQCPSPSQLTERVTALPWQQISEVVKKQ